MSILTTIYGASDDLVEITSVCFGEELNVHEKGTVLLSDGTEIEFEYDGTLGLPARRSGRARRAWPCVTRSMRTTPARSIRHLRRGFLATRATSASRRTRR